MATAMTFHQARAQSDADSLRMVMGSLSTMFDTDDIVVAPTYTFQHSVRYASREFSWKGENKELMTLHYNEGSDLIGVDSEREVEGRKVRMMIVCDHARLTTINFVDADTVHLAMRMRVPDPFKGKAPRTAHFERTDSTLTIAGIPARKWVHTDDKEVVELWMSARPGLGPVCKAWGKLNGQPHIAEGDMEEGLVLKARMRYVNGEGPHTEFEAIDVRIGEPYTFRTEGYIVQ